MKIFKSCPCPSTQFTIFYIKELTKLIFKHADVAQLAEQLICNQQVIGSSPIIGFPKSLDL